MTFLGKNPLDCPFLETLKLFSKGRRSRAPDDRTVFELATDEGQVQSPSAFWVCNDMTVPSDNSKLLASLVIQYTVYRIGSSKIA